MRAPTRKAITEIGEHTDEILEMLGFDADARANCTTQKSSNPPRPLLPRLQRAAVEIDITQAQQGKRGQRAQNNTVNEAQRTASQFKTHIPGQRYHDDNIAQNMNKRRIPCVSSRS